MPLVGILALRQTKQKLVPSLFVSARRVGFLMVPFCRNAGLFAVVRLHLYSQRPARQPVCVFIYYILLRFSGFFCLSALKVILTMSGAEIGHRVHNREHIRFVRAQQQQDERWRDDEDKSSRRTAWKFYLVNTSFYALYGAVIWRPRAHQKVISLRRLFWHLRSSMTHICTWSQLCAYIK